MIFGFPTVEKALIQQKVGEGSILTFLAPLAHFPNDGDLDYSLLDVAEQRRVHQFKHAPNRRAFILGRLLLRSVLGDLLPDSCWELQMGPHGKPFCLHPLAPHFNISHGGGWLGLTLCQKVPVGIDLENSQRVLPYKALAKRYFTALEQAYLEDRGQAAFFEIWVRKEACVKATGMGLTTKLSDLETFSEAWSYHALSPRPDVCGVIAQTSPALKNHLIFA